MRGSRNCCGRIRIRSAGESAQVSTGVVAGALASMIMSRQLGSLLHGVRSADPLVFAAASAVLFAAALAASYLPARRASNVDPLIVLREE